MGDPRNAAFSSEVGAGSREENASEQKAGARQAPGVSVGDDTPSGEPETGPKGPYITDKDDGSNSPANETVNDKLPAGVKNKERQEKQQEKRREKPKDEREEQPDERKAPDPLSRGGL